MVRTVRFAFLVCLAASGVLAAGVPAAALPLSWPAGAGPAGARLAPAVSLLPLPVCLNEDPSLNGRCELWRASDASAPAGMVLNRAGSTVYRAATNSSGQFDLAAYNASNGSLRWATLGSPSVPPGVGTQVSAVAVSPDGSRVFLTGSETEQLSLTAAPYTFYLTVAYAAASGRQLWAARYFGVAGGQVNVPTAIAVAPNSATVFVTGTSVVPYCAGGGPCQIYPSEYATVAYAAASGRELWAHGYAGVGAGDNQPTAIAVGASGTRVYVTGVSQYLNPSPNEVFDAATVAYASRGGQQLWASRLASPVYGGSVIPTSLAASPRDDRVYIAGAIQYTGNGSGGAYAGLTAGYATNSGRQSWQARYLPAGSGAQASFTSIAVDPSGDRVYVTGSASASSSTLSTLAYTAGGSRLWTESYLPPVGAGSGGGELALGPGGRLYVAGWVGSGATSSAAGAPSAGQYPLLLCYSSANGAQLWLARYDLRDPTAGLAATASAVGIAVSASEHQVIATWGLDSLLGLVGEGPPPSLTLAYQS